MATVENSGIKLTYDDYVAIPEDGKRHEIIDGGQFVTPSPSFSHQHLVLSLSVPLYRQIEEAGIGRVVPAPMDVLLSPNDIVQPDIVVVSAENESIITDKNIRGAPDLLVEVLSASTSERDRRLKKALYARFGVREYWIADPESKLIEQYVLGESHELESRGERREEIASAVFARVRIDLTRVW